VALVLTRVSPPPAEQFLLYPDQQFRIYWDFTMLMLIVYSAIAVPMDLAFEDENSSHGFSYFFSWFVDVFFIVDVVLNFFTAFRDGALIVTDRKKIVYR